MAQKPLFMRMGTLVDAMATTMSMTSGIASNRVSSPRTSKPPQTISTPPHERRHEGRRGNADLEEPADPEAVREDKLLNSLGHENASHEKTHEDCGSGGTRARAHAPADQCSLSGTKSVFTG